jgi:hypothetical protein
MVWSSLQPYFEIHCICSASETCQLGAAALS